MTKASEVQTDGIVTSDVYTRRSRKKAVLGGVVAMLVLTPIAIGIWYGLHQKTANNKKNELVKLEKPQSSIVQGEAIAAANRSGINEGLKIYDDGIAAAKDPVEKRRLYIAKATLLLNSQRYDEALAAVQAADVLKADYRTWGLMGVIYDKKGDTAKAILYYEKSVNANAEFNYEAGTYSQRLKELRK